MGRKKRTNAQNGNAEQQHDPKKLKQTNNETGEKYLVKKYRPEKIYSAMEAFVKYTKSHRMLDASYIRWKTGVTPEKPFVFSTRVGGQDLGWGRGRTREAAMDAACRAAFALVAAHGYNNFPLDDDCMMEAPMDPLPPPPPPPPPPPGVPGVFPGASYAPGVPPPLPPGLPPGLPPPPGGHLPPPPVAATQPSTVDLIPQAQLVADATAATSGLSSVPTAIHAFNGNSAAPLQGAINMVTPPAASSAVSMTLAGNDNRGAAPKPKKKLKGGLTLVYDPDGENEKEISMEETRAFLPRYQKMFLRAMKSTATIAVTTTT